MSTLTVTDTTAGPADGTAAAQWRALGVAVRLVVTDPVALDDARALLGAHLDALDLACSRFRPDSELVALDAAAGTTVPVSPLLARALGVALDAARATDGDVDPTLGAQLSALGYDRTFRAVAPDGPAVSVTVQRRADWRDVELDLAARTVRVPVGIRLDLGATAKAWAADEAAARIHRELGCGVLVSLGGDLAAAGPCPGDADDPERGWPVAAPDPAGATVALTGGGIATSGVTARRWVRGGDVLHHVLDPRTGMPAATPWRTVTVAASSCLAANVASTAAIVRGRYDETLPARLVGHDGRVSVLFGWPPDVS